MAKRLLGLILLLAMFVGLGGCVYDPYYHRSAVVYDDGTAVYSEPYYDGYNYYPGPYYYDPWWGWPYVGFGFYGSYHGGYHHHHYHSGTHTTPSHHH